MYKKLPHFNSKDTMNNIVARRNKEEKSSSVQWERQEHLR